MILRLRRSDIGGGAAGGVYRGGGFAVLLRCGRKQLPQALHAVTASTAASSLAREPWGRVAGVAREDKIYRPQKMFLLHESTGTRLPRGGRVGRVLPAVVADTAKAEGVAFHTHRDFL